MSGIRHKRLSSLSLQTRSKGTKEVAQQLSSKMKYFRKWPILFLFDKISKTLTSQMGFHGRGANNFSPKIPGTVW